MLPLGFELRPGLAARPTPARHRRDSAGPERWCATFARGAVEVLAGERPAAQMVAWTSRPVHALLERRAALAVAGRGTPAGRVPSQRRAAPERLRLGRLHVRRPADTVLEANVVLHDGARARAMAFRLVAEGGKWICTALELG